MRCTKLVYDMNIGTQRECGRLVGSGNRCEHHRKEDNSITMESYRYTNDFIRTHLSDEDIKHINIELSGDYPGFEFKITYKDDSTGYARWHSGMHQWTFGSIGECYNGHVLQDR